MSYTVYKGPAQVEWGGIKFIAQGEVSVTVMPETFDIATDAFGTVDTRLRSRMHTISFTPSGRINECMDLILAAAARACGVSVLSGALVVRPLVGSQPPLTFDRAGVTAVPMMRLGAGKTLWGAITFTALETAGENTGVIAASGAYVAPVLNFLAGDVLTQPWTGSWVPSATGVAPAGQEANYLVNMDTEDGWEITTELSTEASRVDAAGVVDLLQTDCKVTARCKPVGMTDAALMIVLQRSNANRTLRPGDSIGGKDSTGTVETCNLILTGRNGFVITLRNCGIKGGTLAFGAKANRTSGVEFTALRNFVTGAPQPLITYDD